MSDLQAFLNKVSSLTSPPVVVKLPSTGNNINITPLNIVQQKKLLTDGITNEYELIGFTKTLNEIISEEVPDARLSDRSYLSIILRSISIDKQFDGIDLTKLTDNSKWLSDIAKSATFSIGDLTIAIEMPFLRDEIKFLDYLKSNLTDDEEYNTRLIYSLEVLKYIKTLTLDGEILNLSDLDIKTRLSVFDKLPIVCTKDIVSYIESFKNAEADLLTIDDTTLVIDREFFSV